MHHLGVHTFNKRFFLTKKRMHDIWCIADTSAGRHQAPAKCGQSGPQGRVEVERWKFNGPAGLSRRLPPERGPYWAHDRWRKKDRNVLFIFIKNVKETTTTQKKFVYGSTIQPLETPPQRYMLDKRDSAVLLLVKMYKGAARGGVGDYAPPNFQHILSFCALRGGVPNISQKIWLRPPKILG